MPNWCYQQLQVSGSNADLNAFVKATKQISDAGETYYGLNHLFPIPQELRETKSGWFGDPEEQAKQEAQENENILKYGFRDWYDWANSNWGTKWGACDFEWTGVDDDDTSTCFSADFTSAWSPISNLLRKISEDFPKLVFSLVFTEESDAFVGYEVFYKGEVVGGNGEAPKVPQELIDKVDEEPWLLDDWRNDTKYKYEQEASEDVSNALQELHKERL